MTFNGLKPTYSSQGILDSKCLKEKRKFIVKKPLRTINSTRVRIDCMVRLVFSFFNYQVTHNERLEKGLIRVLRSFNL